MQITWKRSKTAKDVVVDTAMRLDRKIIKSGPSKGGPSKTWWVGYVDGVPVAYCAIQILTVNGERRAFLYRAGVMPGYRGHGIHKRMIAMRERWASRHGCKVVCTYVNGFYKVRSLENLIRGGYRITRRRDDVWFILEKRIRETTCCSSSMAGTCMGARQHSCTRRPQRFYRLCASTGRLSRRSVSRSLRGP